MPLRPATTADLPAILEIYNDAVLHSTSTYDYEPQTLEHRQAWFERLEKGGYPVHVFTNEENRVLAWGALNPFHTKPGYRFTTENSVYVAAAERGQGLGTQLLRSLIDAGQQRGYHSIIALIDSRSTVSIRLHSTLGFHQVAHLKEVGHKFGAWLDVLYMQKML